LYDIRPGNRAGLHILTTPEPAWGEVNTNHSVLHLIYTLDVLLLFFTLGIKDPEGFGEKKLEENCYNYLTFFNLPRPAATTTATE